VRITIQSLCKNFRKDLTCLTISMIANLVPAEIFPRDALKLPRNVKLADPEFYLPRPVGLLIGSGATLSLLTDGRIDLSGEGYDLHLQNTRLGWVIAGGTPPQLSSEGTYCMMNLDSQLIKFWSIDEITGNEIKSEEDSDCEAHFANTVARLHDGRYVVRLSFRKTNKVLGESRSMAFRRLLSLERKLSINTVLRNEYERIFEEYLRLEHMSLIRNPDDRGYYMPHHAVMKEESDTTKVRIVFDASMKSNTGMSLNDILMTGPTIQAKLFLHLIRFRVCYLC
ncbi:hypothetical protein ALC57_08543, partial [Trachymyrmex cornetzi]